MEKEKQTKEWKEWKEQKDKIEKIEEAKSLIMEAKEIVDEVVEGTPIELNYKAYGSYGFDRLLGTGNPYDDSLNTIEQAIENDYKGYV